jgi:hypothetical protein
VLYPVQIVSFKYIFDNSLRDVSHFLRPGGPFSEAWRATFGPRATGWEPLVYTIEMFIIYAFCIKHLNGLNGTIRRP